MSCARFKAMRKCVNHVKVCRELAGVKVIVACDMGGSLQTQPGADTGFQSQSLKAAHYLIKAGYRDVKHIKGGIDEYKRKVGPVGEPAEMGAPALQQ